MALQTPTRVNWTTQQGANLLPTRRIAGANEFNQTIKALGAIGRMATETLGGEGIYYGGASALGTTFENAGALGNSINARVFAYFQGRLYCAGSDSHVYRLSGKSTWEDQGLVAALDGLWDMISYNGYLHVCGNTGYVYKLVNGAWASAGQPYAGAVNALQEYNGQLFAAAANGHVYEWASGTTWTDRGQVGAAANIYDLEVYEEELYASTDTGYMYEWAGGSSWTSRGQPSGGVANVRVLATHDGDLFAASSTTVYIWDGGSLWTSYGIPEAGQNVQSLVSYKNNLYSGSANGNAARWSSGTTWVDFGLVGALTIIRDLFEYNNRLYVGGDETYTQIFRMIDINDDSYFDGQNYPLTSILIEDDTDDKTTWGLTTNAKTPITFIDAGPVAGSLYAIVDTLSSGSITIFAKAGSADVSFVAQASASAAPANSILLGTGTITGSAFTTFIPSDVFKQSLVSFRWQLTADNDVKTQINTGDEFAITGDDAMNTTLTSQSGYTRDKMVVDLDLVTNGGLEFIDGKLRVRTKDNYIIYVDDQGRLVGDPAWFIIGDSGSRQLSESGETMTITGNATHPDVYTYVKTNSGITKEIGIKLNDQLYTVNQWGNSSYENDADVPVQTFQNNVYFEGGINIGDVTQANHAVLTGVSDNEITYYLRDPGSDKQLGVTGPIARYRVSTTSQQATAIASAINWQTQVYSNGIYWSATSNPNRIYVQPGGDGYYLVATKVGFKEDATGYREVQIVHTSVGVTTVKKYAREVAASGTRPTFVKCYEIMKLVGDNYVEVKVLQNSGGNLDIISSAAALATYNQNYSTDIVLVRLAASTGIFTLDHSVLDGLDLLG